MMMAESATIALDAIWASYDEQTNVVSLWPTDNNATEGRDIYLVWKTPDGMTWCALHDEDSNEVARLGLYDVTEEQIVILLFHTVALKEQAAE